MTNEDLISEMLNVYSENEGSPHYAMSLALAIAKTEIERQAKEQAELIAETAYKPVRPQVVD